EVVQMVRHNDIAYHAHTANGDSVGIEHVARASGTFGRNDPGLRPTSVQYCASAALVRWLCEQYRIAMDRLHVQGHAEADPRTSNAGCPNAVWDWDSFMRMVTSAQCLPPPAASTTREGIEEPPAPEAAIKDATASAFEWVPGIGGQDVNAAEWI